MTQVRPGSTGRRSGAVAAAAAFTLCAVLAAVAADTPPDEPVRLADILTGPDGMGSYPSELTKAGDRVVFAASSGEPDTPSSDREVWVTDGTAEGTYRLADIWLGTSGSDPRTFVGDGTRVWFTAVDGGRTRDLWVTDGTPGGTTKVTSMPEGSMGVGSRVAIHGGGVWFIADDGVHGVELWKTDGSPGGESLVADIVPGADSPDIYELRSFGGRMYFTCNDGVRGTELWSSDGTAAGTDIVIDLHPTGPSNPQELTPWNGELWFRAETPGLGYELWASDGTAAGTRLVKDMWPGDYSGFPMDFEPAGDVMYFAGQATWTGYELWRTDGTTDGTWLVRDIYPGSGGSALELTLSGGLLYFRQNEPGTGQFELWRSDGTYEGTWQVKDILPGGGANPSAITPFGTGVVFSADDGVHGYELWRSDGTAEGTYMIRDHVPGPDGGGNSYAVAVPGGIVYGGKGGAAGFELCRSDGTEQGTYVLANLAPDARSSMSRASATHRVGARAVFRATDEDAARAPFASDGTPGGTSSLRSSANGPPTWDSQYGIVSRGMLWFAGDSAAQGRELWVTDGTVAGTRLVKDLAVGASGSYPDPLGRAGNHVLFSRGDLGGELWATDGTDAGTRAIRAGLSAFEAVSFGDRAFVAASGDGAGREPWITDGTPEGTFLLKDIRPGAGGSNPHAAVLSGGFVWFLARDDEHGEELWRTDGTAEGTALVADVRPGPADGASIAIGAIPGGAVVFAAWDDLHGRELWRSDGTTAGTVLVADLLPGPGSTDPEGFVRSGDRVYFFTESDDGNSGLWVTDGTAAGTRRISNGTGWELVALGSTGVVVYAGDATSTGRELWRTDGTEPGTWLVADVFAGPGSSTPAHLCWAGAHVFFSAWDDTAGREPWSIAIEACGVTLERLDSDGDGASDRLEELAGTSPWDDADSPVIDDDPAALRERSGRITLNFRRPNRDTVGMGGFVSVPAGFDPEGAVVLADIGGVTRRFVLDKHGRSTPRGKSSFTVTLKRRRGVVLANPAARFSLSVANDDCSDELADEGLTGDVSAKKAPRRIATTVLFAGRAFEGALDLRWTAVAGRSGIAR